MQKHEADRQHTTRFSDRKMATPMLKGAPPNLPAGAICMRGGGTTEEAAASMHVLSFSHGIRKAVDWGHTLSSEDDQAGISRGGGCMRMPSNI